DLGHPGSSDASHIYFFVSLRRSEDDPRLQRFRTGDWQYSQNFITRGTRAQAEIDPNRARKSRIVDDLSDSPCEVSGWATFRCPPRSHQGSRYKYQRGPLKVGRPGRQFSAALVAGPPGQ